MILSKISLILTVFIVILVELASDMVEMITNHPTILRTHIDRVVVGHIQAVKVLGRIVYHIVVCIEYNVHRYTKYYIERVRELNKWENRGSKYSAFEHLLDHLLEYTLMYTLLSPLILIILFLLLNP